MTEAATATPKKTSKKPASKASPKPLAHKTSGLYAVIATGGKQYRLGMGDTIKIEKLPGDLKEGDSITFDNVLLIDNGASEITLGNPFISGKSVTGTLKRIARYKTIDVIKYKQKSRYFKKYGHRQPYFEVQIDSIK